MNIILGKVIGNECAFDIIGMSKFFLFYIYIYIPDNLSQSKKIIE